MVVASILFWIAIAMLVLAGVMFFCGRAEVKFEVMAYDVLLFLASAVAKYMST